MSDDRHYVDGAATPAFAKFMVELASAGDHKLTTARILWYAQLLDGIPLASLQRAAVQHVDESRFFPSVSDLKDKLRPRAEDAAVLAWSALDRAAADVGSWRTVVIEDPAAGLALMGVFGSWPAFCDMGDGPQLTLKRQEFLVAYRAHRNAQHLTPVRLRGLASRQGIEEGEPVRLLPEGLADGRRSLGAASVLGAIEAPDDNKGRRK